MQNLITFIGEVCARFGILNLAQSSDIGQNTDGGISDFRIPGQTLIKVNCHNSRTTDDIEMKLERVKRNKRNRNNVQKIWRSCCVKKLWRHCYSFNLWPILSSPEAGYIACVTYIFFNSNLLSYRNWKQDWKISNTAVTILLWVKVLLLPENAKIMQTSAKLRGSWY